MTFFASLTKNFLSQEIIPSLLFTPHSSHSRRCFLVERIDKRKGKDAVK